MRACDSLIKVPVRTTNEVKEPHLRNRVGVYMADHPYSDGISSFMVDIGSDNGLLQCGLYEIAVIDTSDPDYERAMQI